MNDPTPDPATPSTPDQQSPTAFSESFARQVVAGLMRAANEPQRAAAHNDMAGRILRPIKGLQPPEQIHPFQVLQFQLIQVALGLAALINADLVSRGLEPAIKPIPPSDNGSTPQQGGA